MSNPMGDRNLLVGILAWQKKFISGDTLTAAMTAWTLAKDKGLAQILREQNALTENQHALLEEAAHNQLSLHGNDVTKSLAALEAVDPIKQELAKIADADLQASLAEVAIARPVDEPAAEMELIEEVIETEGAPRKKATPVKPVKAAAPKSAASQPPAQAAAGGIGMLAWLAGGLVLGSSAVCCVAFSIGLTVVLMRGQPPVAQGKPDPAPINIGKQADKPDDQPPPLEDKVKPDQPPLVFDAPIVDRKPAEIVGDAIWRIDGNDLVVDNPTLKRVYLYFGSKAWTDFDFSYETNSAARNSGTLAAFRATDTQNHYGFSLGAFQRTKHTLSRIEKGLLTYDVPEFAAPFQFDQWYAVRIEARGNRFRCFVDGVQVFDYQNDAHAKGQVALGATPEAKARWKHIRVTTPGGGVLWDGLPEIAATNSRPSADGFVSLFNGKDLTGWQPHAQQPGDWRVVNGILSGFSTGNGHLFTTRGDYRDFHLRVEARAKLNKAGGVRFRYAQDLHGYETTVNHRSGGMIHIRQAGANVRNLGQLVLLPPDEWATVDIVAQGNRLQLKVNGKTTVDAFDERNAFASGHICLYDFKESIEFRRIEIKELKPAAAPLFAADKDFVPLFNGKDLTGWKLEPGFAKTWRVENGILTSFAADKTFSHLASDRAMSRDFHLRVEMRTRDKGLARLLFRCPDKSFWGYEAPFYHNPQGGVRAGWLNFQDLGRSGPFPRTGGALIPTDQWFTLEVIAEGNHLVVKVDGKVTTDLVDASHLTAGPIALSHFGPSTFEVRKIEIKEFKAVAAPPPVAEEGFVPLFNGKDLTGWRVPPKQPGDWRVKDGILLGTGAPLDGLYTTRDDFKDFHLRIEARINAGGRGAVFCRGPFGPKTPPGNPLRPIGFHAVLDNAKDIRNGTGTITYTQRNGLGASIPHQSKLAPGEWFTLDIVAKGNEVSLKLNGKFTGSLVDINKELPSGTIALFLEKPGTAMEFRKIEIKEPQAVIGAPPPPPAPAKDGFAPLFNGKDLTGWRPHAKRPGNWRVENGILIGSAPNGGALYSTRNDYQDFHLRAEVRINDKGFGRVFGRAAYDPTKIPFKILGYEVLLNQRPVGDKTGTLTATSFITKTMTRANESAAPPGEWFLLEILAQGDLVTVKINAKSVADFRDEKRQFARSGHIALHQDANATIEFRKIEIEDLAAR